MRIPLLILSLLFSFQALSDEARTFENQLLPFTSDGCSRFPDAIGNTDWSECCVVHDVAYWQGGTAQQRAAADEELQQCVSKKAGSLLGELMKLGVRPGGMESLPTSWHWGYGWVLDRGYNPLSNLDKAKVEHWLSQVDWANLPIISNPSIRTRASVVGDYCIDEALWRIAQTLDQDRIQYQATKDVVTETSQGWIRELSFEVSPEIWTVKFLLLIKHACTTPASELVARGRIRWFDIDREL